MSMIKKFVLTIALLAMASGAVAQTTTFQPFSTSFIPPQGVAGLFSNGTAITSTVPILLPNGSTAAPSLASAENPDTGFYFPSGAYPVSVVDGVGYVGLGYGIHLRPDSYVSWNTSAVPGAADLLLYRDAANTLALRNGTNAQAFNIYNTYTDGSNYERLAVKLSTSGFDFVAEAAGTGTNRLIRLNGQGGYYFVVAQTSVYPSTTDAMSVGGNTTQFQSAYLSRSIQGSKSKALTESAATAVTQIAVPQTAGANYADATIDWAVYATDGTDSQMRRGTTYLAAVNKAGTETCTVGDVGTPVVAVSVGTLTCTTSCITGLTDVVQFALNCVSSLTQSTFTAQVRANMMQPNTLTPQ